MGTVDTKRLNYAILSLVTKCKGANNVRQFRLIAFIKVLFEFVAKAFAIQLAPICYKTLSLSQTTFIKGRNILDGIVSLHEVVHGLHVSGQETIVLKLDFEKTYDYVRLLAGTSFM